MAIPPELQQLIARTKQDMPQLAHLPDETVAQLILQTMQKRQTEPPASDEELRNISPEQLGTIGEQMMNIGRWDEAEKYFFRALENAGKMNDIEQQIKAIGSLGYLCRQRGEFPQAMTLFQGALALAEQIGDRHSMSVIYDRMGSTYLMQGSYSQAIEYYKKAIEMHAQIDDEEGLAIGYGNLGIVYRRQGDYERGDPGV